MSSSRQRLEDRLNSAVETLLPPVGKASLFAINPPSGQGGEEDEASSESARVDPKTPKSRRTSTTPRQVHPAKAPPAATAAEPELDRAAPELLIKSTYMFGKSQDDKLRRLAVRQKLPLDETMRLALQRYIEVTGLTQDLTRLAACPIENPAKSEPGMPRIHLRLRPDQVEVLRQCRLLFGVEASEVLRRAIDTYYAQPTTG